MAKYTADWNSLAQYQVPPWFRDAKFGIFAHWGVYAVPAYKTEWYPRYMYWHEDAMRATAPNAAVSDAIEKRIEYRKDLLRHHESTWGPLSEFGYKDFIPLFTADSFDARHWTDVAKKAGARYFVTIAEHHDGFAMYDSQYTEWNAAQKGPKRDIVAAVKDACEKDGLHFGVSSHRAWNWFYYHYQDGFDTMDPRYEGLYNKPHELNAPPTKEHTDDWYRRTIEVMDRYEPDLVWFDWCWDHEAYDPYRQDLLAHYYNMGDARGKDVVLNAKTKGLEDYVVFDVERGVLDDIRESYWQGETSVSHISWCHVVNDHFKNASRLIYDLVDIVSKNGNFLLNIGPRADGRIPAEVVGILTEIGQWLEINGEAIYGTTPWVRYGESDPAGANVGGSYHEPERVKYTARDIRFTRNGNALYATFFDWPGHTATIPSLADGGDLDGDIIRVGILGGCESLAWTQDEQGLHVTMPPSRPCDHAFVLRVQYQA